MKLLVLSSQSSEVAGESIIWTLDMVSKQLVKAHVAESDISVANIGDCITVSIKERCKKQEVWIEKCIKSGSYEDDYLCELLNKKSSTPFSIIEPSFVGNICKIEEFISVDKNEAVVSLYGFPKEKKYIQIFDAKWCLYSKHNLKNNIKIVEHLNAIENKYLIVDFPNNNKKGLINVAALVVI